MKYVTNTERIEVKDDIVVIDGDNILKECVVNFIHPEYQNIETMDFRNEPIGNKMVIFSKSKQKIIRVSGVITEAIND